MVTTVRIGAALWRSDGTTTNSTKTPSATPATRPVAMAKGRASRAHDQQHRQRRRHAAQVALGEVDDLDSHGRTSAMPSASASTRPPITMPFEDHSTDRPEALQYPGRTRAVPRGSWRQERDG